LRNLITPFKHGFEKRTKAQGHEVNEEQTKYGLAAAEWHRVLPARRGERGLRRRAERWRPLSGQLVFAAFIMYDVKCHPWVEVSWKETLAGVGLPVLGRARVWVQAARAGACPLPTLRLAAACLNNKYILSAKMEHEYLP